MTRSTSTLSLETLRAAAASLVGETAWAARLGIGSFLTVEFGDRRPASTPSGNPHGEFHLWAYCAAWRIDEGDAIVIASEDDRERITDAIRRLDGRVVEDVSVSDTLELVVHFDEGVRLALFPIFSRGFEHWMLFVPAGEVYTAGPGTTWTVEGTSGAG